MPRNPDDPVFTPTPVGSSDLMGRIDKIDRLIQRVGTRLEPLPKIQEKVEGATQQLVALDTKLGHVQDRLVRAENKIDKGHECAKTSDIRELKEGQADVHSKIEAEGRQGIKTLQIVRATADNAEKLEKEISGLSTIRRDWAKTLIVILLALLPPVGSGIWFVSQLSTRVERNEVQQTSRHKRVEAQLKGMPNREDQRQLKREVQQLRTVLERQDTSRYDDISTICRAMTPPRRWAFRRQLRQLGVEVPAACLEE